MGGHTLGSVEGEVKDMVEVKTALVSVFDKTGLKDSSMPNQAPSCAVKMRFLLKEHYSRCLKVLGVRFFRHGGAHPHVWTRSSPLPRA